MVATGRGGVPLMAVRSNLGVRNVNGEFISPDVRLSAFADTSRYTLECTVANAAHVIDPTKSASVFIEWLDEVAGVWRCGGGAHWVGSPALDKLGNPPTGIFTVRSWIQNPDGTIVDPLRGQRVRIRITTPASDFEGTPLFPGTSGTVRLSARILDERAT